MKNEFKLSSDVPNDTPPVVSTETKSMTRPAVLDDLQANISMCFNKLVCLSSIVPQRNESFSKIQWHLDQVVRVRSLSELMPWSLILKELPTSPFSQTDVNLREVESLLLVLDALQHRKQGASWRCPLVYRGHGAVHIPYNFCFKRYTEADIQGAHSLEMPFDAEAKKRKLVLTDGESVRRDGPSISNTEVSSSDSSWEPTVKEPPLCSPGSDGESDRDSDPEFVSPSYNFRGVTFDQRRNCWRAFWTDRETKQEVWRYFPVSKHGFDVARMRATRCRVEAEWSGKPSTVGSSRSATKQSGVKGVSWNEKSKAWFARWWEGGQRKTKFFRVAAFDDDAARLAATRHLQEMHKKCGIKPDPLEEESEVMSGDIGSADDIMTLCNDGTVENADDSHDCGLQDNLT